MDRLIPFTETEATCNCGCGLMIIHDDLLDALLIARYMSPYAFPITSWVRCEKWNREVGGAFKSRHLTGQAVDIFCSNDQRRYVILSCLMKAGLDEIVIGPNDIHVAERYGLEYGYIKMDSRIRPLTRF